jgi:hypothetical protein
VVQVPNSVFFGLFFSKVIYLMLLCFIFFRKHAVQRKISNLGYAFVNFTTPAAAFKFYKEFQGFAWNVTVNQKICEINAAQYQVSLLINFIPISWNISNYFWLILVIFAF